MKSFKLTKDKVESLPFVTLEDITSKGTPIRQVDYFDRDLPCFGVRVSSRTKTYFVLSRVKGKKTRVTVGKHGTVTADQARKKARKTLAALSDGEDINQDKARDRSAKVTLGAVLEQYVDERDLRPNTVLDYQKVLRLYVSDWLKKPMIDISAELIKKRHQKIKNKIGPVPANKLARYLRLLFNYAIKDPTINLDLGSHPVAVQWGVEKRRKTYLNTAQLSVWVQAVQKLPSSMMQDYFMLLLYTGLRKNEALSLKWSSVNMGEGYFFIPGDIAKNKDDHYLPITHQLEKIFTRRASVMESDYVFPGTGKTGHLAEPRKQIVRIVHETQKILNDVESGAKWEVFLEETPANKIKPGIKFCNHDLRRTFASIAEALVSYSQLKRLLNHSAKNDVTDGYVVLDVEKLRGPAQSVANEIDSLSLMQEGKVLPFKRSVRE